MILLGYQKMATNTLQSNELFIVAEIHPQHGGDLGLVREMIRVAKQGGANAVKVQLYDAAELLGKDWSYLEFSREDFEKLRAWCDQERIEFVASVFHRRYLAWCREIDVKFHKIASRTVRDDPELCESILAEGLPTFVSLGMWTEPSLPFGHSEHLHYLYCKSKYPALWEDMHDFPSDFLACDLAGYSDHTLGLEFCYLAIARGAWVLEKHLTLDKTRNRSTERAHICSMTPNELGELRRVGGAIFRAQYELRRSGAA